MTSTAQYIDQESQAARVFYRLARDFALQTQPWETAIYHDVKPDEEWDLTLVSRRVYDTPDEFLVIMAAAGLDGVDQPLKQIRLTLPNATQLKALKRIARFESRGDARKNGKPTWLR